MWIIILFAVLPGIAPYSFLLNKNDLGLKIPPPYPKPPCFMDEFIEKTAGSKMIEETIEEIAQSSTTNVIVENNRKYNLLCKLKSNEVSMQEKLDIISNHNLCNTYKSIAQRFLEGDW